MNLRSLRRRNARALFSRMDFPKYVFTRYVISILGQLRIGYPKKYSKFFYGADSILGVWKPVKDTHNIHALILGRDQTGLQTFQ